MYLVRVQHLIRRIVIRSWHVARAACLVAGMAIGLLFAAEVILRGQRALRRAISGRNEAPANPEASKPWYAQYAREAEASQALTWKPYVYFRRKPNFRGEYINIDSAGNRVTPQRLIQGVPAAELFFFGGSTMWGWFQRDDHTIPAEAARRLAGLSDSVGGVRVTNFGETGYVFTQEVLELMLQLRAGARPDVVVFYDGINDVAASLQTRAGGIPQNESKRVSEFELGRQLDRARYNYAFGKDLAAMLRLAAEGLEHMEVVQRILGLARRDGPPLFPADSATDVTVAAYVGTVEIVEALRSKYGFEAFYIWQPTLYSTQKVLTPYEASLRESIERDSVQQRLATVHRAVPARLDSALKPLVGDRFIDATSLFQGATGNVYVDRSGHGTEEAVPATVDVFWPQVRAVLEQRLRSRRNAQGGSTPSAALTTPPIRR